MFVDFCFSFDSSRSTLLLAGVVLAYRRYESLVQTHSLDALKTYATDWEPFNKLRQSIVKDLELKGVQMEYGMR